MQNYATKRLNRLPQMNADRWTAAIIWLIGVYTTRQALIEVGIGVMRTPDGQLAVSTTGQVIATVIALGLQWILTRVERRVWLGKVGIAPVIALILDTLANAAGMFPYIRNFGSTAIWAMLQTAFQSQAPFTLTAALGVCIGLGYAVARLPEQLWEDQ
jgi:hypothetical protein